MHYHYTSLLLPALSSRHSAIRHPYMTPRYVTIPDLHHMKCYPTCTRLYTTAPYNYRCDIQHYITSPNFTYTRLDKTIPIQYIPILTFTILNRPKPYSPLPTQNLLLLHSTSPYLTLLYHYIVIHLHHGTKLNMTIPLPCFSTQ